jgi:hypothetical protein
MSTTQARLCGVFAERVELSPEGPARGVSVAVGRERIDCVTWSLLGELR